MALSRKLIPSSVIYGKQCVTFGLKPIGQARRTLPASRADCDSAYTGVNAPLKDAMIGLSSLITSFTHVLCTKEGKRGAEGFKERSG